MRKIQSHIINSIIAVSLSVTALSCAPREVPVVVRDGPRVEASELGKKIHALINRERVKRNLSRLEWNGALSKIAGRHSRDMGRRNYFSHRSPEGYGFSDRYRKSGYSCSVTVEDTIYAGAENIYQNNLYDRVVFVNGKARYDWNSAQKIAETTVDGWMDSPGHRKNILSPYWKTEGIGVFIAPDGRVYITQNFC